MQPLQAIAVVFGATGNVGQGAAQALLAAGATVLAPTRTDRGAASLSQTFAGQALVPLVGDVSTPEGATALAKVATEHGPIDHVVVSLGPWWQGGPVADQDPQQWGRVRAMLLDGHVHAATTFLPHLRQRPSASYTVITGMGAHHVIPGTSLLFVATNGVLGLSKVLRAEHANGPVRVNELLIGARVEKTARPGVVPSAVFGQAVVSIVRSDLRGEVIRYDGPDSLDGTGAS